MHRVNVILLVPYSSTLRNCRNSRPGPGGKERPRAAMSKSNYPGGGTTGLTKTFINASRDRKSLPTQVRATMGFGNLCFARLGSEAHRPAPPPQADGAHAQVHVRPSNINCNSLRSDFRLTKFGPSVLIGCVPAGFSAAFA